MKLETEMEQKIYGYLKELTAIPSVSNTPGEKEAAKRIGGFISGQSYFMAHPEYSGQYPLPGDALGRMTPYGLVRGTSARTIILTGHYDVVDIQEYGRFGSLAYDIEAWSRVHGKELEELCSMLPAQAREDLASGQWIFGRGTGDMKGGLSIGLALLDWYGTLMLKEPTLSGNLLFVAVADEEAYSAGMRGSVGLFEELRRKAGLRYDCLVDLEPVFDGENGLEVHIGSVGKTMPAVLVQGTKAHVAECFRGLNAVGVLAELFMKTELMPEFSETYQGEHCPPPTWFHLRDRKEGYDVSVPYRAAGYMSMLGFAKTPEKILVRLKELGRESFRDYLERMKRQRDLAGSGEPLPEVCLERCVLEYGELVELCRRKDGVGNAARGHAAGEDAAGENAVRGNSDSAVEEAPEGGFEAWYQGLKERIGARLEQGRLGFPQATLEMMDELLTYSGIACPVMVLGFAPPFYPAFHSDRLDGDSAEAGLEDSAGVGLGAAIEEGEPGSAIFQVLWQAAAETCGVELKKKHYFCGISDLSYCGGLSCTQLQAYAENAPLWGDAYQIDTQALSHFRVPALLFGPVGRDAHRMSERVKADSLLRKIPSILQKFIEQMFAN